MDKVEKFRNIANELADLYERKNNDYGDSFGKAFELLGITSALTPITHKFNRIISLHKCGEEKVKGESMEDSLRDLANYCIMTLIELGYGEGESKG